MNSRKRHVGATAAVLMIAFSLSAVADELALPPIQVLADGEPLDVMREGHSAPFAGDFDGDGIVDLLVGQYEGGKLRIYRNVGTNESPRFGAFEWFRAGGQEGRVPEG